MHQSENKNQIYHYNKHAQLRNFQYDRTGATDLLPLRDMYCSALERSPWK